VEAGDEGKVMSYVMSQVPRMNQWGHRVIVLREKTGLTYAGLATVLGVTTVAVANWVSGKKIPKASSVQKIEEIERKYAIRPDQDE